MKCLASALGLVLVVQMAMSAQYEIPSDVRAPGGSTIKRTGPRTGPTPRLPDGTPDLNGVWVGGGPVNDHQKRCRRCR